ncbi:hypothetical protein KIN34_06950 [Cellulomonas sp. DKR-3]|uniref:Uncharacterized protein n=1 Tax=Cellulomonas fulva TaxID=2835530 RepID=A0ABS5TXZ1_9CELL|nr:hypothetical protein [Cellulomonas fulva]MBT0994023.1 hypothetical protein [Cellulomonas fulva]
MAQPAFPAVLAPASVAIAGPAAGPHDVALDDTALDSTTIADVVARADVLRLRFSPALPTPAAVRALVGLLDDEIARAGRGRSEVRLVLEVETVVARDEADAARRRSDLAYTAAFSHTPRSTEQTWLVAPVEALADAARALARRTGVDRVELALTPASRSAEVAAALRPR